jgi:bifunctional ADP-heptose synthase (sugar kinase/adenylyltransferase)
MHQQCLPCDQNNYKFLYSLIYGQGVFSETTAQFIISNSRRHGIPTIVDPGKRGRYDRFYGATYIKLNHREICNYSDHKGDIVDACRDVCEKLKSQVCIATLSEKGIAFYHKGRIDLFYQDQRL